MGNGAQDPALATQAAVQVRVESERSDGAPVVGRRLVALQVLIHLLTLGAQDVGSHPSI